MALGDGVVGAGVVGSMLLRVGVGVLGRLLLGAGVVLGSVALGLVVLGAGAVDGVVDGVGPGDGDVAHAATRLPRASATAARAKVRVFRGRDAARTAHLLTPPR